MHKIRKVVFLSQARAEAVMPDRGESIISITDRDAKPADLNDGWSSMLRIQCNDVDPDEDGAEEREIERGELSGEQAEEIADYVLRTAEESRVIVVHCRFGQSRSPAVAKAICEHFGLTCPPGFELHNRFVQRLVFNAISRRGVA